MLDYKLYQAEIINNNTNDTRFVLSRYMELIEPGNTFYIDIGSSYQSNLDQKLIEDSEICLFFDCDPNKQGFKKLEMINKNFHFIDKKVTPDNIIETIQKFTPRTNPKIIDLDIDGYDFYVLESILQQTQPSLIVAEINEKIPPPIKFTVKYDKDYWWDGTHFYGVSLSKIYELFDKFNYDVINLTHNNVFAVRKEFNPGLKAFRPIELYDKFYINANWEQYFSYNKNVKHFLALETSTAYEEISFYFRTYFGKYLLHYETQEEK